MTTKLKELRKKHNLTQKQVAKLIETTQSQYGKYEIGKTKISLEKAQILANYYEVSLDYLLGNVLLSEDELYDPGKESIYDSFRRFITRENMHSITRWTPYHKDLQILINDINRLTIDELNIKISRWFSEDISPVVLTYFSIRIKEITDNIIIDFNGKRSYNSDSGTIEIWENWIKTPEYEKIIQDINKK